MVWVSSNQNVLAIDSDGMCVAKKEGTAIVSVSSVDGSISDSITIEVKDRYNKIGQIYVSKWGLECTVNSIRIEVEEGTTSCKINYTLKNITSDQKLNECTFYCTTKSGDTVDQYGFFNSIYPGESTTRSYTFKTVTADPFVELHLENSFDNPVIDSSANDLIWNLQGLYE